MYKNNINLNLYKDFYAVAKYGSLSKASKATFTSAPAISKSIKKLEEELNRQLFYRNPNGMELTNHGKNSLEISNISNLKILGLDIYSIPLSTSLFSDVMRGIGKVLQPFFHPVISPTFCHIALKLNLENLDDIVIIEYGQYLTEESLRYFDRAISNLGSSDYRSENNKAKYYYIKKDGVRITKIEKKNRIINLTESVSVSEYLNEVDNSILDRNSISKKLNQVNIIKCNVKKNMTLKQ